MMEASFFIDRFVPSDEIELKLTFYFPDEIELERFYFIFYLFSSFFLFPRRN